MKKIAAFVIVMVLSATVVSAEVVTVRSESSGTYEDGVFTPGTSSFEARYIIDEVDGEVILSRIIKNDREGRIEEGIEYEITNMVVSEGLSSLLVSRDKKGQKIITAVREGELGASEMLILGSTFYEYCKAANGKFYLEYGKVTKD